MDRCGREAQFNLPYFNFPTGSINTTIMELGPKSHNGDGLSGLNSIIAVYMDPLGFDTFELADVLTTFRFKLHCLEALIRMTLINMTTSSKAKNRVQPLCETLATPSQAVGEPPFFLGSSAFFAARGLNSALHEVMKPCRVTPKDPSTCIVKS